MLYDSLLSRIAVYSALALLATGLLTLFILLKLELHRRAKRLTQQIGLTRDQLGERMAELRAELRAELGAELRAELAELKQQPSPSPAPATEPAVATFTYHRRNQILDLHERGLDAPAIATSLRVQEGEVRLLLKIHQALSR